MSTADHTQIPLAILPSPVPPALIRARPPQHGIPATKELRDRLLEAVRRGLASSTAVPPLAMEE
ncbi:MAG: hypothetical protein ACKOCN_02570, partial [Planctomycetaceae bacterium]